MNKWRHHPTRGAHPTAAVPLSQVLETRGGPVNEVECWALLGQAGQALQDQLLSINGRQQRALTSTSSLSAVHRYDSLVLSPAKVLCTGSGKVAFDATVPASEALLYRHPSLGVKLDLNERELEAVGVFSLAKTCQHALNYKRRSSSEAASAELRDLLSGMLVLELSHSVTLLTLLSSVSAHWSSVVGHSPISRFVSQMCKVTLGWASTSSIALTNHDSRRNVILDSCIAPSSTTKDKDDRAKSVGVEEAAVEVEFSRLESSSSSSSSGLGSEEPAGGSSPMSHAASMPNLNNNNNNEDEGDDDKRQQQEISGANPRRTDLKSREEEVEEEGGATYENFAFLHPSSSSASNLSRGKSLSSSVVASSSSSSRIRHGGASSSSELPPDGNKLKIMVGSSKKRRRRASGEQEQEEAEIAEETAAASVITCPASAAATKVNPTQMPQRSSVSVQPQQETAALGRSGGSNGAQQHSTTPLTSRRAVPATSRAGSTCSGSTSASARVRRNPSRLYRQVKPLTDIAPAMSPATKRCVGPEFVVMGDNAPLVIDLSSHGLSGLSRRESAALGAKQVHVAAVNGQRITVHVNPNSVTAGEVLDHVLSHQDIKESAYYGLAVKAPGASEEYWMLASDTKLHKVAPHPAWRDARPPGSNPHGIRSSDAFAVYLRFKHLPDSVDAFRDPHNKHQFYLQLRRDVIEGRYNLPANVQLALAGLALQTEFGDFSEDLHGDCDYFLLEHYLPAHVIRQVGVDKARLGLARLHRAHRGQSQSKTELKYCKEVQRSDNFGFHTFSVQESKKAPSSGRPRHVGIHLQGVFVFETSPDPSAPHKLIHAHHWHQISRIQYDKTRFQLSVEPAGEKVKFYVPEVKAKLMFDLASAHHQFFIQQRWEAKSRRGSESAASAAAAPASEDGEDYQDCRVEYREPRSERTIKGLKNRLLAKRQISQRKLYTKDSATSASSSSSSSGAPIRRTRSRTVSSGGQIQRRANSSSSASSSSSSSSSAKMMVKRLTHYSSMADALSKKEATASSEDVFNESNKENETPRSNGSQQYRYKVYLEPEEDLEPPKSQPQSSSASSSAAPERVPLQERPVLQLPGHRPRGDSSPSPPPPPPRPSAATRRRITTLATPSTAATSAASSSARRRSEGGRGRRSVGGAALPPGTPGTGANPVRMGTRISLSALHRERLRLTSEFGQPLVLPPAAKKPSLDLDYGTMEVKSLLPAPPKEGQAFVVQASIKSLEDEVESVVPTQTATSAAAAAGYDDAEESLTDSLLERFDNMESDEPERQIVSASLTKDASGRLGLKITGTPGGIYIEEIDAAVARVDGCLKLGDRIVAINGRSLENVAYSGALDLIRRSGDTVHFLVSQMVKRKQQQQQPEML